MPWGILSWVAFPHEHETYHEPDRSRHRGRQVQRIGVADRDVHVDGGPESGQAGEGKRLPEAPRRPRVVRGSHGTRSSFRNSSSSAFGTSGRSRRPAYTSARLSSIARLTPPDTFRPRP